MRLTTLRSLVCHQAYWSLTSAQKVTFTAERRARAPRPGRH